MTTQQRIIIANLVGIVVLAFGMWGIEVDAETQAQIVAGLGAIGTVINMAIVHFRGQKTLVADELEAFRKRELGYVRPSLCFALAAVLMLAAALGALPGCKLNPVTPYQAIGASAAVIEQLASEIGTAQQLGQITVEREAELLDRLQVANDTLRRANAVAALNGDTSALMQAVSAELARIRAELAREASQ